jgi:AraC-like DNA-binding protein
MTNEGIVKEHVKWWRLADAGRPELLSATFQNRSFSRHAHENFAIGVIESGALSFHYRGKAILAPAGHVNLAFPGEPHDGKAGAPEGWSYRMFYLDMAYMLEVARGIHPDCTQVPFISAGAVQDPDLANRVATLHRICEDRNSDPLQREVLMCSMVRDLILRYAEDYPKKPPLRERAMVLRAKKHLEESFHMPVHLDDLSKLTGMNPYQLVRSFTRELGLPPHAYLVQVRLRKAAQLIRQGVSLIEVAFESGFTDQSHLNRHFIKTYGVTPGTYRMAQ